MISKGNFRLKKDRAPYSNCFCRNPEQIENYEAAISDTTQIWQCHHRLETHNSDGERRLVDLTREELIALDIYYDRLPEELIFLAHSEHVKLHKPHKGKKFSEETKMKLSEAKKGRHHSDETKKKMSEVHKGKHLKFIDGKRTWC